MPKIFALDGTEIGKEYYMTPNSGWDSQIFEFTNGSKVIFARKYGGMGFDRFWENTNRGLETYESWQRRGCLPN